MGAQHIKVPKNITQEFIEYSVSVVQILMHWHKAVSRGSTIKITKKTLRFMKFTTNMHLR
jgi:ribonucleotide reductase beta subunit family protein with ferritin-like domain